MARGSGANDYLRTPHERYRAVWQAPRGAHGSEYPRYHSDSGGSEKAGTEQQDGL